MATTGLYIDMDKIDTGVLGPDRDEPESSAKWIDLWSSSETWCNFAPDQTTHTNKEQKMNPCEMEKKTVFRWETNLERLSTIFRQWSLPDIAPEKRWLEKERSGSCFLHPTAASGKSCKYLYP